MGIVTIRGGPMCNWERNMLEDESDKKKNSLLNTNIASQLSHFVDWPDLKRWLEDYKDKLIPFDTEDIRVEAEKKVKQKRLEIDLLKEKLNSEIESNHNLEDELTTLKCEVQEAKV